MTFDPKGGTGSAFCVASDEQRSLYVTNAHVVAGYAGLTLYRQDPEFAKMTATVVARGTSTDLDLAVLSVPVPHVASVTLRATPPDPGARVALAGYPRVLIWAAPKLGGIAAAVYEATVNEINPRGTSMLHDAVSRPGCSGGPIFDPATGYVFGVNWAGYDSEGTALAVGLTALTTFLDENGVAYRSELDERSGT
jgi:S1-C subfamily serine protease